MIEQKAKTFTPHPLLVPVAQVTIPPLLVAPSNLDWTFNGSKQEFEAACEILLDKPNHFLNFRYDFKI